MNEVRNERNELSSSAWLGVDSAPQDGTPILAWNAFAEGSPYPHGKACVVYWDSHYTRSWTGSICETNHLRVTHWMPLPSPPNTKIAHSEKND